jgi:hypothetical protein
VDSLWSAKFAKALTGEGAAWSTVLGHELELIPLDDPSAIKPGKSLRLRLLFHGSPLAGAQFERADGLTAIKEEDIPRFTTDRHGIAVIPIEKSGPILLVVDHRVVPSATPEIAAADLFNATLWFVVAGTHGMSNSRPHAHEHGRTHTHEHRHGDTVHSHPHTHVHAHDREQSAADAHDQQGSEHSHVHAPGSPEVASHDHKH